MSLAVYNYRIMGTLGNRNMKVSFIVWGSEWKIGVAENSQFCRSNPPAIHYRGSYLHTITAF